MNVGAVLVMDSDTDFDLAGARQLLETRLAAIPRLRQRLVTVPFGCGRPIWVDDPRFQVGAHVEQVRCRAPGDHAALLDTAVVAVTSPLVRSRPLWRAVLVTDLADGSAAIVFVLHHVVADGIGGLAVLAALVDEAATGPEPDDVPKNPAHSPRPASFAPTPGTPGCARCAGSPPAQPPFVLPSSSWAGAGPISRRGPP